MKNFKILFLILFLSFYVSSIKAEKLVKAPDFELWGFNGSKGNMVTMDELKGNVILINFWSTLVFSKHKYFAKTGAPKGTEELFRLNSLYNEYKNKKVKVVTICVNPNMATREFKGIASEFLSEMDYYILLSNGGAVEQDFGGVPVIPTTFIIDKKGLIRQKFAGEHDMDVYRKEINKLLEEK